MREDGEAAQKNNRTEKYFEHKGLSHTKINTNIFRLLASLASFKVLTKKHPQSINILVKNFLGPPVTSVVDFAPVKVNLSEAVFVGQAATGDPRCLRLTDQGDHGYNIVPANERSERESQYGRRKTGEIDLLFEMLFNYISSRCRHFYLKKEDDQLSRIIIYDF